MILKKRIPENFYKLFRTKNMDAYMQFLVAIYEENNELYTSLGLTLEEAKAIISEVIAKEGIFILADEQEDSAEAAENVEQQLTYNSPSALLNKLIRWGWLKKDFDDRLNQYVVTFPEYSQVYVELFQRLQSEDDAMERESILSVYSSLYTYHTDREKNQEILLHAMKTSRRLGQMLSNMQDGMRAYFDELSSKKNFIGIQQVLVEEINNSDSKKYAILTTSDSFYRYKESVKELIGWILTDHDEIREKLMEEKRRLHPDSIAFERVQVRLARLEQANKLIYHIEREFDLIERKYNKLIEQKAVFAKRALARIQYIMQEGADTEDNIAQLIGLLDRNSNRNEILQELSERMGCTSQYKILSDKSLSTPRGGNNREFSPVMVAVEAPVQQEIADFVPQPLYTKKELDDFRRDNTKNGRFVASKETVSSVGDLEKLLFLWQEATGSRTEKNRVVIGEELQSQNGLRFSSLEIKEE